MKHFIHHGSIAVYTLDKLSQILTIKWLDIISFVSVPGNVGTAARIHLKVISDH